MRKALWVVRDRITNAHAIDELLADATTRGIFDLVVQVRGRGDAYYRSKLEPQALRTLAHQRGDVLVVIRTRRVRHLRVTHVVVVETLDRITRDDVAEDRKSVLARRRVGRIDVDAFPIRASHGIEVFHPVGAEQPIGMLVHEMRG